MYVLSSSPLSNNRTREVLKSNLADINTNTVLFSTYSFRYGGASAAANLGVPEGRNVVQYQAAIFLYSYFVFKY